MGKRRIHRQRGPRLSIPESLIKALESIHGPLDNRQTIGRIVQGVQTLHQGLTRDRGQFVNTRYMQDPDVRFAYSTYFICAQAPKLWPILNRLFRPGSTPSSLNVLEVGCGPGTGLAAMVPWASERNVKLDYLATDYSGAALKDATRLGRALGLAIETQQVDLERPIRSQLNRKGPFDLVLAMNVFNELSDAAYEQLHTSLVGVLAKNGHLVFIEPAAREPSRRVLELRDHLVSNGWEIHLPCTHQLPCPALERNDDWCHETWAFDRPNFMAHVDKKVGTRRETLKATWFVMKPPSSPTKTKTSGRVLARAVSELFVEKGRVRIRACSAGKLLTLELQRRDRSQGNRALMDASRFSLLSFKGGQPIGDAIRLGPDAACIEFDEPDEGDD